MATTFELIITVLFYIFIGPPVWAYEYYQDRQYLKSFGFLSLFLILVGGLITLAVLAYTSSRGCPEGQKLFIVQRDAFNLFTPEYSVYMNKAPVGNYETESYPPVVRVDTPTTDITKAFFPQFEFTKPEFPAEYEEGQYKPLVFKRITSFKSLLFPSYEIFQNGTMVGRLVYPTDSDEATLLGLTGLEKRYVAEIKGKMFITSEEFLQLKFVKEIYFYDAGGSPDRSIAVIKPRAQLSGLRGAYTVCLHEMLLPEEKEVLFASVIAMDQHVFKEERQSS